MRIIFLDGFYAGHTLSHRDAPPTFKMRVPPTKIVCDCDDEQDVFEKEEHTIEYKRTFIGEDREVCLYSVSGESKTIEEGRGWIVKEKPYCLLPGNQLKPLTIFCRDERAWD